MPSADLQIALDQNRRRQIGSSVLPYRESGSMVIKNVLLALITYPEPTPMSAIWDAATIAEKLGSKLSIIANEMEFHVPSRVHPLADALINIPGLARAQIQKSVDNADNLISEYNAAIKQHLLSGDIIRESCFLSDLPDQLAEYARYADLSIVPIFDERTQYAEAIIFNSGRPALIIPCFAKSHSSFGLDTAIIAWDGSRAAARAVGDAIPMLKRMKHVRIVVALDDKTTRRTNSIKKLTRYLKHHGIIAPVDGIDASGRAAADVLTEQTSTHHADLLVMGAFGHSRLRDFILGGATASMLKQPPLPILMSH
jgi:nucleotide-binding universal stress UspA family protein